MGGQPVTTAVAIEEAARILAASRYPIVYGLSDTTVEAQRVAVEIADCLGACLDTTTSVCHGPSGIAFQVVGEATCTLGEVKNRADMVIFWGGNPAESHPRHFTKYSVTAKGHVRAQRPEGPLRRARRRAGERPSARAADLFLQVKPGKDFELLWALRGLVKGVAIDPGIEAETGIALAHARGLVERMKRARYGVLLFGMGLSLTRGKHYNAAAILALARDLNQFTRFLAKPMRGHGNVTGADNVVSWSTGYPVRRSTSGGAIRASTPASSPPSTFSRGARRMRP